MTLQVELIIAFSSDKDNKLGIFMLFFGWKALLPPEHQKKKQHTFCNLFWSQIYGIDYNLISLPSFPPLDIRIPLMWKGSDHFSKKESM